ncbi:MAG: Uma2 family endonuclease [Actinomycetota bacterium]|nr:Uma2 family endonuclease [Actinomycetota bacterium]
MSAAPLELPPEWPTSLLTAEEYLQLGETELRTELVEGVVTIAVRPAPKHMIASFQLTSAIARVLPPEYQVVQEVDLDLQLVPSGSPGFVRAPDLAVIRTGALRRVHEPGGVLCASDVVLVVEIVSPGSVRNDRVTKRAEYADAGIPYYWIVDIEQPVSLLAHHLAGELGYADDGEITGTFRTDQPFGFELELSRLL